MNFVFRFVQGYQPPLFPTQFRYNLEAYMFNLIVFLFFKFYFVMRMMFNEVINNIGETGALLFTVKTLEQIEPADRRENVT